MGGDWNLVLDPNTDYCNYKHVNNPLARDRVEDMILNLDLTRSKCRVQEIYLVKASSATTKPSVFCSHFGIHDSVCRANGYPVWIPIRPFYDCSEISIWKKRNETKNILES